MAKKNRRRPNAGPPPVKNVRHDAKQDGTARPAAAKRLPGQPVQPTFLSVVVRSVLAIAIFIIITTATGSNLSQVAPIAGVLFLFMVIFGFLFDKWFYKVRMRRWQAKHGGTGS